jgi:FlaG/FlaF family flagellin (archaellin)
MKKRHHLGEVVALALAAALCTFTPGLFAQAQPATPQQQQQAQPQTKTYAGKIMKLQDGKYALVTGQNSQGQLSGHFLDDQSDASKYEGKKVRVTGTLDMASNTIHVTRIVAA